MSDRPATELELEILRRHVREGKSRVALQISIIETLDEGNHIKAAALARRVLEAMRISLDMSKQHLLRIELQSKSFPC